MASPVITWRSMALRLGQVARMQRHLALARINGVSELRQRTARFLFRAAILPKPSNAPSCAVV
jgi:hypothetical protein